MEIMAQRLKNDLVSHTARDYQNQDLNLKSLDPRLVLSQCHKVVAGKTLHTGSMTTPNYNKSHQEQALRTLHLSLLHSV